MGEDFIQGVGKSRERKGQLGEAANRERRFGVEVEGGGGEAAKGERELGSEEELEGDLGFPAAALGH